MPKKTAKAPQMPPARPRLILRRASIRRAQQEAEEAARAAEDYRRAQERLVRRELDRAKRKAKRAAEAGVIDVGLEEAKVAGRHDPREKPRLFVFYTDDGTIVALASDEAAALHKIRRMYLDQVDDEVGLTWDAYYRRYIEECNIEVHDAPFATWI